MIIMFFSIFAITIFFIYMFITSISIGILFTDNICLVFKKYNLPFLFGFIIYFVINISFLFLAHLFQVPSIYYVLFILLANVIVIFWIFSDLYIKKTSIVYFLKKIFFKNILFNFESYINWFIIIIAYISYLIILSKHYDNLLSFHLPKGSQLYQFQLTMADTFKINVGYENKYFTSFMFIIIFSFSLQFILKTLGIISMNQTVSQFIIYVIIFFALSFVVLYYANTIFAVYIMLFLCSFVLFYDSIKTQYQRALRVFFSSTFLLLDYFINSYILIIWFVISIIIFIFFILNKTTFVLSDILIFLLLSFMPLLYEITHYKTQVNIAEVVSWIIFYVFIVIFLYFTVYKSSISYIFEITNVRRNYLLVLVGMILILILWSYILSNIWPWDNILYIYNNYSFIPFKINMSIWKVNLITTFVYMGLIGILSYILFMWSHKRSKEILFLNLIYLFIIIFMLNPFSLNIICRIFYFFHFNATNNAHFNMLWNPFSDYFIAVSILIFIFLINIVVKIITINLIHLEKLLKKLRIVKN